MGRSAPGMNTTRPTPAFCTAVAFTASTDSGRRTKGNAKANARRLSRHASMIHSPMRRSSERGGRAGRARTGSRGVARRRRPSAPTATA